MFGTTVAYRKQGGRPSILSPALVKAASAGLLYESYFVQCHETCSMVSVVPQTTQFAPTPPACLTSLSVVVSPPAIIRRNIPSLALGSFAGAGATIAFWSSCVCSASAAFFGHQSTKSTTVKTAVVTATTTVTTAAATRTETTTVYSNNNNQQQPQY